MYASGTFLILYLCFYVLLPSLTNHPGGHWSQDSFHHSQMFPVVMSLQKNIRYATMRGEKTHTERKRVIQ